MMILQTEGFFLNRRIFTTSISVDKTFGNSVLRSLKGTLLREFVGFFKLLSLEAKAYCFT